MSKKAANKKSSATKPTCPKCKKLMQLVSTGSMVRTFYCSDCKKTEIIKRKED